MAAEKRANNSKRSAEAKAKLRHYKLLEDPYADLERARELYALKREHTPERERLNQERNEETKAWRAKNPEKTSEYNQASRRRVRLSKRCYCDPCGTNQPSEVDFRKHLASDLHKRSIIRVAEGRHLQHRYYLCHSSFDTPKALRDHEAGKEHKKKAAAPDAAMTKKAARAKAIADRSGAIEAAKAAIRECGGDYSKAISKFNTELDPVDDGPPEVFNFKGAWKPDPDTVQPQPQLETTDTGNTWFFNSPHISSKDSSTEVSSSKVSSSEVSSAADMQSLFKKREYRSGVQTKLAFGVSTQIKSKRDTGGKR